MTEVAILVLAAGRSSRMRGIDKLLHPVAGEPLLRRQVLAALATGAPVVVALPPDHPKRLAVIVDLPVMRVTVLDAADGMGASIRAGVAALPDCRGVAILPGDMPDLTSADLRRILDGFLEAPARVARGAAEDGTPGHPVVFPARLFPALRKLSGDSGARSVLAKEQVNLIRFPGQHARTDLDTPEDWAAWLAENRG